MPDIGYKIFFNNKPATCKQLDRIEDITVEQEVDMAWEARIEVPICVDENGRWIGEDDEFMKSFSRIRIEVGIGKTSVPLIDGHVISDSSGMDFKPGQSFNTIIVRDDSICLDRKDMRLDYENKPDHQIAREIFELEEYNSIRASIYVEETTAAGNSPKPVIARVSTHLQLLRSLAKRHNWHAYVLPSNERGKSIFVFRPFPKIAVETPLLPDIVTLGTDRNANMLNFEEKFLDPSRVTASTINIKNKKIISSTASPLDRKILGDRAVLGKGIEPAVRILPPGCKSADPVTAASAEADRLSYAVEATGSVLEGCYPGVLQPYRLVNVKMGDTSKCGPYVITRVTHRLTRSTYSQSFSLIRDALSERSGDHQKNKESSKNPGRDIS